MTDNLKSVSFEDIKNLSLKELNYWEDTDSFKIFEKNLLQETGDKYPRGFRKVNVIVGNSNVLDFQLIEKTLDKLLQQYKQQIKTDFPLKVAFDFYLEFEKIHPFENGNGRIGRLLLNKILIQNKFFPMIIFSENKQAHFSAISSTKYNKKKYYKFMLQQYEKTLNKINYE